MGRQNPSEVVQRQWQIGFELQGLLILADGFPAKVLGFQDDAESEMDFRVLRLDPQSFAELSYRFAIFPLLGKSHGDAGMSFREAGLEMQGLQIIRNGLVELALAHQGLAETPVCRSEFWTQSHRLGVVEDGLIRFAKGQERIAEVKMPLDGIRSQLKS